MRSLLAFALAALLAGCAAGPSASPSRPAAPRQPDWIALERTAGVPAGPVYVVTLFEDGSVLFEGRSAVKSKGTFTRKIPPDRAAGAFTRLETIQFWDRPSRYTEERANRGGDDVIVRVAPSDVPWDSISARYRGRFKRIDGLFYAPSDVLALKDLVEQTVDLASFIGSPAEWKR